MNVNTPLKTKYPENLTNAIVATDEGRGVFLILTDFGNLIRMSKTKMEENYDVPNWYLADKIHRDLAKMPDITALERIDTQIKRLQYSKEILEKKLAKEEESA